MIHIEAVGSLSEREIWVQMTPLTCMAGLALGFELMIVFTTEGDTQEMLLYLQLESALCVFCFVCFDWAWPQ